MPLQRTGLNPLVDTRSVVELARMLRRLRPDLLFAYTSKPVIYGTIAARLARVPRVFAMISGLGYAFTGSGELARRLTRQVTSALYRASLRATDGIFFQNPDDLDEFRRRAIVSPIASGCSASMARGWTPPITAARRRRSSRRPS